MGIYVGGSVTMVLGTSSMFSKNLRCSMLLIVPGLFAGRGRAMMITLATGFLLDGPLDSIQTNLEKLIDSFVCLYKQAKEIACEARNDHVHLIERVSSHNLKCNFLPLTFLGIISS